MDTKHRHGISSAARQIGCAEDTVRQLDKRGVIKPIRDSGGRRLLSDADIAAAREYLSQQKRHSSAA
jgi:DNA-binding transcriptional MerR regulator